MRANWEARRVVLWTVVVLGLMLYMLMWVDQARGQAAVTLAWTAPPANVQGYYLYQGGASQVYTNVTTVGASTVFTVSNLVWGATYYFAVTAYNSNMEQSPYSNEVVYQVPLGPLVPMAPLLRLDQVMVEAPVTFWTATNTGGPWSAAGTGSAWMVFPATNQMGLFSVTPAGEPGRRMGAAIQRGP